MKHYIRHNLKAVIAITVLFVFTVALIGTNEIIAVMLPDASELEFVSCEVKNAEALEYNGEEMKAEFVSFEFKDAEGVSVVIEEDNFEITSYINNIEIGSADITVALEGYRNEAYIEDAFQILLGQVKELQITASTNETIDLAWNSVPAANGYVICRSVDDGNSYEEIGKVESEDMVNYQDTDLVLNTTYTYKVYAYMNSDGQEIHGNDSSVVTHTTPLETPVLTSVKESSYNSIELQWEQVPGAAGYQVYRCEEETGEYELVYEIEDGAETTYVDEACSLGTTYYYQIKAIQQVDAQKIYGESSDVLSAKTTLGKVKLSGSSNSGKTSVSLSWEKVEGADGYEIYRSSGSESNYKLVKTIKDNSTLSWTDSELSSGKSYFYKVRAYAETEDAKVTGSYSGYYEKEAKINYNYAYVNSGAITGLTDYVGYPYLYGGKAPGGWDCSGFTAWAMKEVYGVTISQSAAGQAAGGRAVSVSDRSSWQVGDILCYSADGHINHVAIYIGNGQMIQALNEKYNTFIIGVDTYERWDKNTLTAVRRYL